MKKKELSIFDDFNSSALLHIYSKTREIPKDEEIISKPSSETVQVSKSNNLTQSIYIDYRYEPLDFL